MAGLLRGMVRTAAVVGTATATRNAIDRRQASRNVQAYSQAMNEAYGSQMQPVPQAPAPAPQSEDVISQLERLGALKSQGVLTDEEFEAQKAKLLGS